MIDYTEHYISVEQKFTDIIRDITSLISDDEKNEISEFVYKHGEYELGLEALVDIVKDIPLSNEVITKIKELANDMELDELANEIIVNMKTI